jgi:small-conductance mechanosensitive channel
MNGLLGLPEVLGALRSLPEIAANTAAMAEATRTLPEINERLAEVAAGASKIPDIERRMKTIEGAMPTLVEVQQQLRDLPKTMAELQAALVPLIEAADTFGRVARRLPGGRRGAEGEGP